MTVSKNHRRVVSAMLAATLVLAAPLGFAQAQDAKKGGTLIYANNSGPGALDPQMSASLVELEVIAHLYENLVAMGGNFTAKPMLAKSWDISEDGKTFTFHLREGIKFHNGEEMTSADVLATFERYARVSPGKAALEDVKEYRTPDAYTFVIELNSINAVFVDQLKTPVYPFSILPASQKDKEPRQIDIIGTGPFKLGEWVKDSHLIIERNDDYSPNLEAEGRDGYAGKKTVYLDAVRYNFVP